MVLIVVCMGTATTTKIAKAFALQSSCRETTANRVAGKPRRPGRETSAAWPGRTSAVGALRTRSSTAIMDLRPTFSLMRSRCVKRTVSLLFPATAGDIGGSSGSRSSRCSRCSRSSRSSRRCCCCCWSDSRRPALEHLSEASLVQALVAGTSAATAACDVVCRATATAAVAKPKATSSVHCSASTTTKEPRRTFGGLKT